MAQFIIHSGNSCCSVHDQEATPFMSASLQLLQETDAPLSLYLLSFVSQRLFDGRLWDARVWNAVLMASLHIIGIVKRFAVEEGGTLEQKVCWPGVWRPGSLWVGPAGKWAGTTKRNCKQIQTHSKQIWLNQKCMDIGINHMTDSHSIYQQINMLRVRMTWNTTCWLKLKYSTILMGQNYIKNRRPNYGRVLWW